MNDTQRELFEQKMEQWFEDHLYTGANAIARFRQNVADYIDVNNAGRVSDSAFSIVEKAMVEVGELRPIVFDDNSSEIEKKIADFEAGRVPVYNFRLACKADRELRDAYERHTGLAQLASPGR
jgi:hypothetical protein